VQAIGFDLGDTLIHYNNVPLNWQPLYRSALLRMAQTCDITVREERIAAAERALSKYNTRLNPRLVEVTAERVIEDLLATLGVADASAVPDAMEAFFSFFQHDVKAYDDTLTILQWLSQRGTRIGVLTDVPYGMGAEYVRRDLAAAGIEPYVDHLVTSGEVGYRKPAHHGYQTLCDRMGVPVDDLIYIGNEAKDIVGANAVGATSVLLDRGAGTHSFGEKHRISSLLDLKSLLDSYAS
jgi:putative hydrolase of the HAD superfamily